jgi:ABC-type enterobactin transport system permease subunit
MPLPPKFWEKKAHATMPCYIYIVCVCVVLLLLMKHVEMNDAATTKNITVLRTKNIAVLSAISLQAL